MTKLNLLVAALVVAVASFSTITAHGQLISVDETELDFGCVEINGLPGEDCFAIANTTTVVVDYFISISGDSEFSIEGLPIGQVLPGDTNFVTVKYSPTLVGNNYATLSINVTNPVDPDPANTIELIGTGGTLPNPILCSIENILLFFDNSIEDGTLESTGPSGNRRYRALRNRIEAIDFLIQEGYFDQAYDLTCSAILRCDDETSTKDFVQGTNRESLQTQLEALKLLLE